MDKELPPDSGTFSAATKMRWLSGQEPIVEQDSNSEIAQVHVPLDVVVEHRRFGRIELVGALSNHTSEHVPAIAAALMNCSIIGIEQLGVQDEHTRRELETVYSKLLSTALDPAQVDTIFAQMLVQLAGHKERGLAELLSELLSQFKGTDKQIVLLDISRDHPDYLQVQQARELIHGFTESIAQLFPVAEARELLTAALLKTAESYRIRDKIMTDQIQQLCIDVDQQETDQTIGVMVGLMHYRALMETGESADPSLSGSRTIELANAMSLFDEGVEVIREGGPVPPELTNRILLANYLARAINPLNGKEVDSITRELDSAQVARLLSAADRYIHKPDDIQVKQEDINLYLSAIVDIVRRSHQSEQ